MENPEIIETYIDEYLKSLAENSQPSTRLRTPASAVDVDDFFKLVGKIVAKQQQIDGAQKTILYTEEYPEKDDDLEGEAIIFKLLRRKPGTFENQKAGLMMAETNIRQRARFFQESIEDPDYVGSRIYTYSQWYDNLVGFEIHARTNKIANRRALWFENLMDDWAWFLKASGVRNVNYDGRDQDVVRSVDNRKTVSRLMTYFVRTEKITNVREHTLRSLVVDSTLDQRSNS